MLLGLINMPHFGQLNEENVCVKQILVCFHGGILWLEMPILIMVELILEITELPKYGADPSQLLQLILPHMVDHTFMAFPVPLRTLWTPWTIFIPLMFPRSSLKTPIICCIRLLIPFSRIYVDLTLKIAYIGMCAKHQIIFKFSLIWIQISCLLSFHMP